MEDQTAFSLTEGTQGRTQNWNSVIYKVNYFKLSCDYHDETLIHAQCVDKISKINPPLPNVLLLN
jgi:hypothetical protein